MKIKDEENVPEIIKNKLENYKVETKLVNNKEIKVGSQIIVCPKNINVRKQLKISVQIINYSDLDIEPCIPKYGKLISEIFKINITNSKGNEVEQNDYNILYSIKCVNLDKNCFPIVCNLNEWSPLESFEMEDDYVRINEGNWNMIAIVKEPPSEIIKITRNGGLLYSKLDPLMSLRISKGVFKEDVKCKIQVCDMPLQHLDDLRYIYDDQLSPYVNLSPMICIDLVNSIDETPSSPFKRAISVKLRLPQWVISLLEEQEFNSKNIVRDQKTEKMGFYLLQKIDDVWNFVDSSLKFTNTFVEFDAKFFGNFLFVNCRDNREFRLCPNLNLVENLMRSEPGVVLTFLWIKTNDWFFWLEIVPIRKIEETRSKLESKGFIFIEQYYDTMKVDQGKRISQYQRKSSRTEALLQRKTFELLENIQFKMSITGELELLDNSEDQINDDNSKVNTADDMVNNDEKSEFEDFDKIGMKVNKDIQLEEEPESKIKPDLSYHQNTLHSNCLVVPVSPLKRDFDKWESIVLGKMAKRTVYENSKQSKQNGILSQTSENGKIQTDIDDQLIEPTSEQSKNLTRLSKEEKEFHFLSELSLETINAVPSINIPKQTFRFYIPLESIKEYFQVKTKEEKEKIEAESALLAAELEKSRELEEKIAAERRKQEIDDKPKQLDLNHLKGMAKPRYASKIIDKEPKAISRRSFQALSSIVRQGLKLAVYLSIPDNVIAGIGFDALSQMTINGTNNTTYKVLLLWKKMILLNKTSEKEYMDQLIFSLNAVGYERVGQLVYNQWMKQQEITMGDCQKCLLHSNYK